MKQPIRAAVIGAGYLGRFHALKYASMPDVKLVAVADVDAERAEAVARETNTRPVLDYHDLLGEVDCASLAVPTPLHAPIAETLLSAGVDVLVEKPFTETAAEGRRLVQQAQRSGRILQVGHLERFNPALQTVRAILTEPRFVECHRLGTFVERGTDVDVVLDLMIHDLDVLLSLVPGEVAEIESVGVPVLTPHIDIAHARLRFTNGCIANLTASRVALKRERKLRLFQADTYVSLDYGERHIRIVRRAMKDNTPRIEVEEIALGDADPLYAEIDHFLHCVRTRQRPLVDGATALRALEVAERIRAEMLTA
ncbi:MAG: UDP-N-acetylglucosamine 3-dehydrogenase [Candidatus Binatia bacterium]|nr:MAG: UDP-N-acetylglucosamine 3-dehydrogenase [Candidatus Binatia bacterium]